MTAVAESRSEALNVAAVRADFPILAREVHGKPLIYFDNAASAQRPAAVIEAIDHYYRTSNANVHRGVHTLSEEATDAFEGARRDVARFINAPSPRSVIFLRGTTEAVNLVSHSYGNSRLAAGDRIVITHMEHHSNIVPWQLLCERTGAELKVAPVDDTGALDFAAFEALLDERVKLVAAIHVSNALGTINPVRRMIEAAHSKDIPVLLDGAQAVPHVAVDVQALDVDFYCFSAHKMFGPTGIGVLYGKESLLDAMPPWQGGGEMIRHVTFEETIYNELPGKFEAGTPNIAGAIGLGAAVRYLESLGMEPIGRHEHALLTHATEALAAIEGLRLIGTAREKSAVLSFTLEGVHAHDLGTIVDHEGVAIRTGHHCAMPLMARFGVQATARASLAFYNTHAEIDHFVGALERARRVLA